MSFEHWFHDLSVYGSNPEKGVKSFRIKKDIPYDVTILVQDNDRKVTFLKEIWGNKYLDLDVSINLLPLKVNIGPSNNPHKFILVESTKYSLRYDGSSNIKEDL